MGQGRDDCKPYAGAAVRRVAGINIETCGTF